MRDTVSPPGLSAAAAASGFTPAVRATGLLFLTGATGGAADGAMPDSAADQARNALAKVRAILTEAGGDESDVVEITSYHIDIRDTFEPVREVVEEVFSNPLPAWTAVGVAELRRPGGLVEFRIVAQDRRATSR